MIWVMAGDWQEVSLGNIFNDAIVNEVREIRERLSKKHNFEVGAIFDDIRKR